MRLLRAVLTTAHFGAALEVSRNWMWVVASNMGIVLVLSNLIDP